MPLDALDLPVVLQFVLSALLVAAATIVLVKRAASKYFVVDAGFESGASASMSIEGSAEGVCANCGSRGTKKCSRCRRAWYCSQECQSKHWKAGHQNTCKHLKPSDEAQIVSSGNSEFRRRKSSRFSAISLIPARGTCNILKEPKKILFPYDDFVQLFNWDNPGFPPCGLVNCGNSCFANVVLQCLSSTRPLVAFLLEGDHNRECARRRDDWCFLCELQDHIHRVKQNSPFSPLNILSRLPNIGGNLGYGRQEDAHEFMRFAIDTMQSICLDEFGGEKALDLSTQETTLIQYIFGGHLRSQVTCTNCNMTSNRYENMMDLTVEIHGDAESLEQCLDQFTKKEWLDGDNKYKCDWCNDYVKACKNLTVHQAPNILTIALKRFQSGRFGKLNKRVSFPENLDLTPYMSGSGDGTDLYTLYAVVVHVDMLNASFFGHYICYTKDYHGRWYRIDDCKVTTVEVEDVLSEGAYMLLYSRRRARKEPFVKSMEPQSTKQPAEVTLREAGNAAITSPINVTCIPNHHDVRSVDTEVSSLGDTCHDREFAKKAILDVPPDEQPLPAARNSEYRDVNDTLPGTVSKEVSILSSYVPENISTVDRVKLHTDPEISSHEVDAKGCHINNVDSLPEESHSFSNGELSTVSMCVLDGTMTDRGTIDIASGSSFVYPTTAEDHLFEHSDESMAESENSEISKEACSTSCSSMEIDSVDGKTSLSFVQNGSSGKPKAAFSHGFLNKSLGKKSLDNSVTTRSANDSAFHVSQENGYCNGHSDVGADKQDTHSITGNGASVSGVSANGCLGLNKQEILTVNEKYDNSNYISFVSSDALSRVYMTSLEDNIRGERLGDIPEANGGTCLHNNFNLRPQANYCNGASLTGTTHQLDDDSTLANCNTNGVSNKNGQLKLPFDSNSDNNLCLVDKPPQQGFRNDHNGLDKVNDFAVSAQNEENNSRHHENGVH